MSNVSNLPPRRLPVRGSDLLLILIIALGSVRLLAGLLVGLRSGAQDSGRGDVLTLTVILLMVQTAVVLGMVHALVIRKYGLSWADLGLRPVSRRWCVRAALAAILMMPVVALVNSLVPTVTNEPFQNPQIYALAPMGFSWTGLVIMIVMAGVVAPLAEEIAFRGLLYPWLRDRWGVPAAAAASGLCFAALHGVVILIPALTVIGIVLAVLYQRSGSLWTAVIAHGVFNTVMILGLYAGLAYGFELT
ncbi:MAG: type II CAAX endopeptidase family protein [Kiloniellales bacterium]